MCGFAAIAGEDSGLIRAFDKVRHRGERFSVVDGLAHSRLPIVGLGEEHDQPIIRGAWTIAFVGEILDFRDHMPGAECDMQLVADTWVNEGPWGFNKFDGFWTVVARHDRTKTVHILTDYLAQKPAYYRMDVHAVASEPDAVACLAPVTLDEVYLAAVIKWGYCPETWRTPYLEVRKTLPGEYVCLAPNGLSQRAFVDQIVPVGPVSHEVIKQEIGEAVKRRVLSSDVPVASLVSGGLDSAIVHTLASRYGDVHPYHVENGELEQFRAVVPGDATLLELGGTSLAKALGYMQEPLDLGSLVPQVALSDAMAGKTRVCLTGDGADELFGGYGRAMRYDSQASDVWHELVAWHLPRLDRVMMRNKIEVRSPFLARRVLQVALGLSRGLRMDKLILRELFRNDLPAGVSGVTKRALRTSEVEQDREGRSEELVGMFRERCREEMETVG